MEPGSSLCVLPSLPQCTDVCRADIVPSATLPTRNFDINIHKIIASPHLSVKLLEKQWNRVTLRGKRKRPRRGTRHWPKSALSGGYHPKMLTVPQVGETSLGPSFGRFWVRTILLSHRWTAFQSWKPSGWVKSPPLTLQPRSARRLQSPTS